MTLIACTEKKSDFSVIPKITKDEYMRLETSTITLNEYMDVKISKKTYSKQQLELYFSCELLLSHAYSKNKLRKDSEPLTEKCNKVAMGSDATLLSWLKEYVKSVPLQKNAAF